MEKETQHASRLTNNQEFWSYLVMIILLTAIPCEYDSGPWSGLTMNNQLFGLPYAKLACW